MSSRGVDASFNDRTIADFRAHEGRITTGRLAGSKLLLLTSVGARSGRPQTTPLGYTRDGDRYVVVGSNSGSSNQPAWLFNVRADPHVSVEVGTETFPAVATVTTGEERRRLFAAHVDAIPHFATYEKMTERELPVVVLSASRLTHAVDDDRHDGDQSTDQ